MTAAEQDFRLKSVIENSNRKLRDASSFVMAIGSLLDAYASDDISREVMSDLVIGGLASGLMMLGIDLGASADTAQQRMQEVDLGGGQ